MLNVIIGDRVIEALIRCSTFVFTQSVYDWLIVYLFAVFQLLAIQNFLILQFFRRLE